MNHPDLDAFDAHPEWTPLLRAYWQAQQQVEKGWVPRLAMVAEVPGDQLSAIHGRLIAHGLLRFELAGRTEGVEYQLTPLGRQAVTPPDERQMIPEWMMTDEAA
jgi:hypothetical protein